MLVRVKVKAGARKERFAERKPGEFEIDVKEKAEQNTANKRVLKLIARYFHVPEKAVHIVSGHRRPRKTIEVLQ